METIRLLLADDHKLVRDGLRMLLRDMAGIEVVGDARDGLQALAGIEALRPDVALIDVTMPEMDGLTVVEQIRSRFPFTRAIVLTMHRDVSYRRRAIRGGAAGFLPKDSDTAELEEAIRTVARGGLYFGVPDDALGATAEETVPGELITPRQREVLRLIAEGKTTKSIGRILDISVKTVETHRAQLMERLEIYDVAGLTRYAIRVGLVGPEQ